MAKTPDTNVLAHIDQLVKEEHKLFEKKGEHTKEEAKRLAEVQTQLDQCWDLLRQRRALREFGDDPSKAKARSPDVIKKYEA
jgi:ElaB/YqjD/DUF883 family membrane-anchored ribosome-binding protein